MCVAVENWNRGGRARTGATARPRAHHRFHHHWRTPTPGRPRAPRESRRASGEPMGRRRGRLGVVRSRRRPPAPCRRCRPREDETIGVIHPSDGGRPIPQASRDIAIRLGDTGPDESENGESSGVGAEELRRGRLDIGFGGSVDTPCRRRRQAPVARLRRRRARWLPCAIVVGSSGPASGWTAWATSTEIEAWTCTRFVCSTGPSLPGLLILIETLMFTGRYWTASP